MQACSIKYNTHQRKVNGHRSGSSLAIIQDEFRLSECLKSLKDTYY